MGLFKKIAKAVLPAAGAFVGSKVPFIGSAVGSALGTGLSGAIGSNDAQAFAEDQWNANAALQREFAQHGIRWRVEDAKAAGVHPLYALGAGGAAAAPISMSVGGGEDWSGRMGQDVGRAVTAQMDPMQRQLQQAQLEVLRSEAAKNNALALAAVGSKSAVNNQPGQVPFPDINQGPVDMTGFLNQAVIKPVEVPSMSSTYPGVAAGPAAPGMYVYNFGGQPILLPGNSVSEALESLSESPLLMGMTYKLNERHFGEEEMDRFMRDNVPFGREALGVRDAIRRGAEKFGQFNLDWEDRMDRKLRKYRDDEAHQEWRDRALGTRTTWGYVQPPVPYGNSRRRSWR